MKIVYVVNCMFILLANVAQVYGSDDKSFCWSCNGYSPFFEKSMTKNELSFGLEVNRWMPRFIDRSYDVDSLGNRQGPNRLKMPVNGFGVRYIESGKFNKQYISPYYLTSIALISGVSIGPELGLTTTHPDIGGSFRYWLSVFGFECMWTLNSSFTTKFYVFIPILDVSI